MNRTRGCREYEKVYGELAYMAKKKLAKFPTVASYKRYLESIYWTARYTEVLEEWEALDPVGRVEYVLKLNKDINLAKSVMNGGESLEYIKHVLLTLVNK